jgi:hypothetical protein
MLKIKFEHLSVGMDDARNTKVRWKDVVKNDIRKMGIVNWRQVAKQEESEKNYCKKIFGPLVPPCCVPQIPS